MGRMTVKPSSFYSSSYVGHDKSRREKLEPQNDKSDDDDDDDDDSVHGSFF